MISRRRQRAAASIELRREPGGITVVVRGEVDLDTSPRLRERLASAVEQEPALVVVHLDGVTLLDSTGLGVIVGAWKAQRASGRRLEIVCSRPEPLKLLRMTGLDRVVPVHAQMPSGAVVERR